MTDLKVDRMLDFFKKIFGGKETESISLALDSLPGILRERDETAHLVLAEETAIPKQNIRNAVARLQLIVNTIASAEHDQAIHPKLKSIAKNTLPQYIRAMNTSLSKELPEDTEEFYPAAVECVKSCLNNIRGPGRYLQIVFPEEMKDSRSGIDAIGREINTITTAIGTFRKQMAEITEARTLYATLLDTRSDLAKAGEKDQRTLQRVLEVTTRITAIEQEIASIPADPRMVEAEERKNSMKELEQQRDEMARTYAALSMTASHVLRKAEKIASKQKHASEISNLKHAMFLLSDHEMPDPVELETALSAACPIAERMIAAGEISLKNKEERGVFSDSALFCKEISMTCTALRNQEVVCRNAHETILALPILVREGSLEREKTQLGAMLEKERDTQKELRDWQQKTRERIPVLTEALRKKVGGILGKNVQFQDDSRTAA
jgi:hypothetical protein